MSEHPCKQKLDHFSNYRVVSYIPPNYYAKNPISPLFRLFFTVMLLLVLVVFLFVPLSIVSDPFAPFSAWIISGIMAFILVFFILFVVIGMWSDYIFTPHMVQALLTNDRELIKWNCLFGIFTWKKRIPLDEVDFIKKEKIFGRRGSVSHQLVIYYRKDEYGRRLKKKLWEEASHNENVIDKVKNDLRANGFKIKESLISKLF